jgi:hypothetical protein
MFFKLLKLVGIDVTGKLAELKADFELQILQASEKVSHRARNIALVAGFFLCAAIMVLLAVIVCLIALYRWAELHYGAFAGLALVAGVLVILAAILAGIALAYANSRSSGVSRSGRMTAPQAALFAQSIPTERPHPPINHHQPRPRICLSRCMCCSAVTCDCRKPVTRRLMICCARSEHERKAPQMTPWRTRQNWCAAAIVLRC